MSIQAVEWEIQHLFKDDKPRLLCISGKWGVGKTYLWNKLIEEHEAHIKWYSYIPYLLKMLVGKRAKPKRHSYVSLFGLNSLEDVHTEILATAGGGWSIFEPVLKLLGVVFVQYNLASAPDILKARVFSRIRNHLICFDDLERAGKDLKALDILGLACKLKEEQKCKIVFLLNADMLEGEDEKEFNRQIEKVADRRFPLQPTVEESANIGLEDSKLHKPALDIIRDRFAQLDITNIRTIQRVESFAVRMVSIIDSAYKDGDREELLASNTFVECLATLTLAVCSFQQPDGRIPPLSFLRSDKLYGYGEANDLSEAGDETADEKTENYRKFLSDYQYYGTGELKKTILDGVEHGYFDEPTLIVLFQKAIGEELKSAAFHKAWDMYHHALDIDENAFLDALHRAAIDEARHISIGNISYAIDMLRFTERDQQADEVADAYVDAYDEDITDWVKRAAQGGDGYVRHLCSSYGRHIDEVDFGLREALIERTNIHYTNYIASFDVSNMVEILRNNIHPNGWNPKDFALLSGRSVDDFENMLLQLRDGEVQAALKRIQDFHASPRGEDDNRKGEWEFAKKARLALKRIADRSPLQARKLSHYNLGLDELDSE